MAFISTTANTPSTIDLGELVARATAALKRLPLGEERFTGSAHVTRASDEGPRNATTKSGYRPTYALQVV